MKKSREIIAGIGLGASLFGILPGCAAPKDARPEITEVTLPSPQPRIVTLANKLIDLSEISPTSSIGKPAYTASFSAESVHGGAVSFLVQTSEPGIYPQNVDHIRIAEEDSTTTPFEIELIKLDDGSWNATCADDATVAGSGWAEVGQQIAITGPQSFIDDKLIANAILDNTIDQAVIVTDSISVMDGIVVTDPLENVCQFNIGG